MFLVSSAGIKSKQKMLCFVLFLTFVNANNKLLMAIVIIGPMMFAVFLCRLFSFQNFEKK